MDILLIDGVALPAPNEYKVQLSDLDSSDTGRTEDGVMLRNRVREGIAKISASWAALSTADCARILNAVTPDSFEVAYFFGSMRTAKMYAGDRTATLKAAVKYPKVRFLNCSVDQAYSSIRTYYGRIYEAKFITGAIAGAMAGDDRIGYIASYPIFGVPASINAFALGAQMTNPRAQIELRWSCVAGMPQADFLADGIRVVSNRDTPTQSKMYLDFCSYGTYLMDSRGDLVPLASPVWVWGKFYEFVIRSILSGGWKRDKADTTALNYWLGMDSGVIGVGLSDKLPEGVRQLANLLKTGMEQGFIDPFARKIIAQDGTVKNDGTKRFTPTEVLHMDWLCSNIAGSIPPFEDILPVSQRMVRQLGIYRDSIPPEKEAPSHEDTGHLR